MYQIFYDSRVQQDLAGLPKKDCSNIEKTILKKLSSNPLELGKPLTSRLKGWFRLRIGIYRVVYRVEKEKVIVYILKIGVRRDAKIYKDAVKRLDL